MIKNSYPVLLNLDIYNMPMNEFDDLPKEVRETLANLKYDLSIKPDAHERVMADPMGYVHDLKEIETEWFDASPVGQYLNGF